jgi:hypothetical protein
MERTIKKRRYFRRYLAGIILGAGFGFVANQVSANIGTQCTILCQPVITMAYFGLIGFVLSLK